MSDLPPVLLNLVVALGIGLLIGAERERRKGEGPARAPAGIRTFTVASLAGASQRDGGRRAACWRSRLQAWRR